MFSHKIVLMKDGIVIDAGSPEEVVEKGMLNEAFSMDVIDYLGLNNK